MSPKIIKKGEFDPSKLKKFDNELDFKKLGTKESQELKVPEFQMNAQHARQVAVLVTRNIMLNLS